MRPDYGDDYGIACCVSPMKIGKRCSISELVPTWQSACCMRAMADVTEKSGVQVAPRFEPITSEYLDYNEVMEKYER